MLVTKKVRIEFADTRIQAIDAIADIREAVDHASLNLYSRYGIQLQYPMPTNGKVYLEIRVPVEMASNFSYGKRLRGLSLYLLKQHGEKYKQYLVGNRLLSYYDITDMKEYDDVQEHPSIDRFSAVAKFTELLQRTDENSMERIERIIGILNEED